MNDTPVASGQQEFGEPATFFYDFDDVDASILSPAAGGVWNVGRAASVDRFDVRMFARYGAAGDIEEVWFARLTSTGQKVDTLLHLLGDSAKQLVQVFRGSASDPAADGLLPRPGPEAVPGAAALAAAYQHEPEAMRALIEGDATARDVVAVAHRQAVVKQFRRMLEDQAFFEELKVTLGKSHEAVWQDFFETNPWLLGLGLSEHLLLAWDPTKLEQTVVGQSISGPGKRTDALLRTAGSVRLLAFAEIKHHQTPLLASTAYRSGCWAPDKEVVGAVAQSQGTVQLAGEQIREALKKAASDVSLSGALSASHFYQPRSFVVAGTLRQFVDETGEVDVERVRSFELYRRHVTDPVILTFDEVLARAEAAVTAAKSDAVEERSSAETVEFGAGPQSGC